MRFHLPMMDRRALLDFARLTLRKNRLLFWGLTGTFVASAPFCAWVAGPSGYTWWQGFQGALVFWGTAGLALSGVLLGATTGAELRSTGAESAESLLPASHRERAFGAALGAAGHLAGLFVLSLCSLLLLSDAGVWTLLSPVALYASAYLLLVALTCAYAFGNAVVGGLLTLILAAGGYGMAGLLARSEFPWVLHIDVRRLSGWDGLLFVLLSSACVIASILFHLAGPPAALAGLAPWLERRLKHGWFHGAGAAAWLALGAVVGSLGPALLYIAMNGGK